KLAAGIRLSYSNWPSRSPILNLATASTESTDVWSFGVCVWELHCCRRCPAGRPTPWHGAGTPGDILNPTMLKLCSCAAAESRHLAASIRSGQYRLASSIASDTTNRSNSSSRNERMSSSHKKFTVSVEGNIGSGKSTMLEYFSSVKSAQGIVESIPEPIDKWCNLAGVNLLERLYTDPKRWFFSFNLYCMLTRLDMHRLTSMCTFAARPKSVLIAVKLRNRSEESAGVTLSLLENLHQLHEQWLLDDQSADRPNAPVLVLDASQDFKRYEESVGRHMPAILFDQHLSKDSCLGNQKPGYVLAKSCDS
uniref:DNK domain-containing protein n=1 Tax=Macrostomum lignano TaxID=282301 RepID=A0A1I8FEB8_9PLAT